MHGNAQVDGASHVVHSEAEAAGVRLTIDSKTCLLPNEHDPSQLMAASPGKLVRFLVADGAHVQADEAYAEIEVRQSGDCEGQCIAWGSELQASVQALGKGGAVQASLSLSFSLW